MVDVNELRKKFPAKNGVKRRHSAAIKQIAREYEMKKAELNGLKAPAMKRGIVFYVVVIMGLLMLGSLVLSVTGRGGRARISRAHLDARKGLDALAVALGRYRYHTGEYPSTEEGLEALASTKIVKAGWNGPYIKRVVDDPWGQPYVYVSNGEAQLPTLYSKGPDRRGGTTDDLVADQSLFDAPFKDTTWTETWVPYRLRGIIVAPDEETKHVVENQVSNYLAATARSRSEVSRHHREFLAEGVSDDDVESAVAAIRAGRMTSPVDIKTFWTFAEDVEGCDVDVECTVNGDAAELFVNGESAGKRAATNGEVAWRVKYEPGEIKIIGWREGSPIGENAVRTAYNPEAMVFLLKEDSLGDDEIGFAVVDIVDGDGNSVPDAGKDIAFAMEGPGEIVRTIGNAVAFRRNGGSGLPIKLKASLPGVRPGEVVIPWKAAQ